MAHWELVLPNVSKPEFSDEIGATACTCPIELMPTSTLWRSRQIQYPPSAVINDAHVGVEVS